MIRQFVRKALCQIDFWFYIFRGRPLTGTEYYKRDVPHKYWGRRLLNDTEIAPYFLVFYGDPDKIVLTEKDKEWAEKALLKHYRREGKDPKREEL